MPLGFQPGRYGSTTIGGGTYYIYVPCSEERRSAKVSHFDIDTFIVAVRDNMQQKKKEYEKAKSTPVIGALRAALTRYEEKRDFILHEVVPAIKACQKNATIENLSVLARKFRQGAEEFTLDGTFISGIAKIFEQAYFALTDTRTKDFAVFVQTQDKKIADEKIVPVVATVAQEEPANGMVALSQKNQAVKSTPQSAGFFARHVAKVRADLARRDAELLVKEIAKENDFAVALESVRVPQGAIPVVGEMVLEGNRACCVV